MNNYNIIFVEGLSKIGKSSQITLLRQELMKNKEVKVLSLDRPFEPLELHQQVSEIREWCENNPNSTLLINGSLIFSMVHKDIESQKYGSSYPEYELAIKNFFNLLREFKILHLLLTTNAPQEFARITKQETFNPVTSQMFYQGLDFFEQSQLNSNFKWTKCLILPHESMLEIFTKIKKLT